MNRTAVLILASVAIAGAQTEPSGADTLGRSTPYGCVIGFLKAAADNDVSGASQYLDLRGSRTSPDDLVRQLNAVLNSRLSADLDKLSRARQGNRADGLPADRERVGYVESSSGRIAVELVGMDRQPGQKDPLPVWLFSRLARRRDGLENVARRDERFNARPGAAASYRGGEICSGVLPSRR